MEHNRDEIMDELFGYFKSLGCNAQDLLHLQLDKECPKLWELLGELEKPETEDREHWPTSYADRRG